MLKSEADHNEPEGEDVQTEDASNAGMLGQASDTTAAALDTVRVSAVLCAACSWNDCELSACSVVGARVAAAEGKETDEQRTCGLATDFARSGERSSFEVGSLSASVSIHS